ncbi:MAG: prepilin-type N-terminal cleavage/methylation domain-containing protein [bacterium]|nr:prepilin-type N-terminal cleavage/methylation domain-containing protein [bacterium]
MKNFIQSKKNSGFTLIELLVVIAIIGVLASVVLASLNTARAKARDARRRVDLKQVQLALELYYDSNNGYPSNGPAYWGNCSYFGSHPTSGATGWVPNLAPTYIPTLPLDPRPNGTTGCYLYYSNGTDYKLIAHGTMEIQGCPPIPINDSMYDPARSATQCTIAIYSSGGAGF